MKESDIIFYKGGDKKYLLIDKKYQLYRLMKSIEYWAIGTPDGNLIQNDKNKLLAYKSLDDVKKDFETIHERRKRISSDLLK